MTESANPTILIVEDERDLADLYTAWLTEHYTVQTTYSGSQALNVLDDIVDVVLLDRRMPDMSGAAVLDELRDQAYECRVAMVTAVEPDLDIIKMGFDDYLVKPVSETQLHAKVDQLLSLKTYDDQLQELYAAASKKAALDTRLDEDQRRDSTEYTALAQRVRELQNQLHETQITLYAENDEESTLPGFGLLCDSRKDASLMPK